MSFSIKPGARVFGLRPEMILANQVVADAFHARGYECVMTAGIDGKHSRASAHYSGRAVDYRTRHVLPENVRLQIADKIRAALGADFDVLLETDPPHLHVEFDPKDPLTTGA